MIDTQIREEHEFGLAGWQGQSRGMLAAHRHVDLEINFILSGSMTYLVGGRIVELPPRRLCLLWGGVPHQMMRRQKAVEAVWITIPLSLVLRWGLPDSLIRPLLAGGFLADADPRESDLDLLQQWLLDLPDQSSRQLHHGKRSVGDADQARQIVLLEIEARLRRFARGLSREAASGIGKNIEDTETTIGAVRKDADTVARHAQPPHADRGMSAVEAMTEFIAHRFRDEISVVQIADAAHLHPNYAMTIFRRHTGMTLSQYLTLQRVAHAQRMLAMTSDPVEHIALSCGFGSISRFYAVFRQQTGVSPRKFRLHLDLQADQRNETH